MSPHPIRKSILRTMGQISLFSPTIYTFVPPPLDVATGVNLCRSTEASEHNRHAANVYVAAVKKHDATNLHYDLRLGFNRISLSWAISMGPSYLSDTPRRAVEMPDHERANNTFEGVIEEGVGKGVVTLWDAGKWEPLPEYSDVLASHRRGFLRFRLTCQKLKGNWALRRRPHEFTKGSNPIWDLIKEPDSCARSKYQPDVLLEQPNGVYSGRSLEEIKRDWFERKAKRPPQSVGLF